MSPFDSQRLKQIIALTGLILLGGFLALSLTGFIPAFLGAVIFYIICLPFMHYLHAKKGMKKGLAVTIVLITSFLMIVLPIVGLTNLLVSKLTFILSNNTEVFFKMHNVNSYLVEHFGINAMSPENIVKFQEKITTIIPNLINQTFSALADVAIMYFVLFYLLYTDYNIKNRILSVFPYKEENAELFAKELISQTYSNVVGAPFLAVIQGIFSMVGFTIFGLQDPVFWGVMCGFLSFIPFLGTALVWVPAGLILLSTGAESWQGIGLLIYGAVVITNVDNVFRFVIQKKIADVHPLTTVFGVIIGLKWFGLPGLVFGPILISYFLIMLKIYRLEYGNSNIMDNDPSV